MAKPIKWYPHDYQEYCVDHILVNRYCGLFLDMGLGKTAIALTALDRLLYDSWEIRKPLIIAPKKVTESTWKDEIKKWKHLSHLKLSIVLGTERQRIEALRAKADIWIVSVDNIAWLIAYYQSKFPFDCLVIDELSKFKNPDSVRFKALRTVRPKIKRVIGLTGTPVPNGLQDLWSQMYLLDMGERLEKTLTSYRLKYFTPASSSGSIVYSYALREQKNEKRIMRCVDDICISMKAKDFLDLPERIDAIKRVELSPKMMRKYNEFERDLVLAFDDADDISASNAAVLTGKLIQFANGAIYDADKNWHELHTEKLEALEEEIEAANGQPIIVAYWFRHDLERIQKHFKKYKPVVYTGDDVLKRWNKKQIQVLCGHPVSMGHGLNMQAGGHYISWFSNQWGLENYKQLIARLDRQGQENVVYNGRIVVTGTIDEDIIKRLDSKDKRQNSALDAVKARFDKWA